MAYRVRPRPGDLAPELGFEFRLHRGPGLLGWHSGTLGSGDSTGLNARLDVRPVRMANPLFTPLSAAQARAGGGG